MNQNQEESFPIKLFSDRIGAEVSNSLILSSKVEGLAIKNQQLMTENASLKKENAGLKKLLEQFEPEPKNREEKADANL